MIKKILISMLGILFLIALAEYFMFKDLAGVVVALVCFWNTFMTLVILKEVKK